MQEPETHQMMIFIDGECVLCTQLAQWIVKNDSLVRFKIGSLQGVTATQILSDKENFNSKEDQHRPTKSLVMITAQGKILEKSDAIIEIISHLDAPWHLLSYTSYIPKIIRDSIYNLIARSRYKIFGKHTTCQTRLIEGRDRQLD